MKRREFLAASAASALALGTSVLPAGQGNASGKELLELRTYHFKTAAKLKAFDDFLGQSVVPALNRASIKPVGVFVMRKKDNPKLKMDADSLSLFVLMPHKSPDSLVLMLDRLVQDGDFAGADESILYAPKSDPAYLRYESTLMLAFDGVPKVRVPTKADSRVLQLRIYESHNTERALKKIEMFNTGGELEIFDRCGMHPVFFGQALVGDKLPNLTYMLSFKDTAAMAKGWDAFRKDPEWQTLRKDEAYKDTVSRIDNYNLRPTASSQI